MKSFLNVLSYLVLFIYVLGAIIVFGVYHEASSFTAFVISSVIVINGLVFFGLLSAISELMNNIDMLVKKVCFKEIEEKKEELLAKEDKQQEKETKWWI